MNLEKTIGPLRLRAWGLIVNLIANAMALYGLSQVLSGEGGVIFLVIGGVITLACLLILATPVKDDHG